MTMGRCSTCEFAVTTTGRGQQTGPGQPVTTITCHRYPPSGVNRAVWPIVSPDDACGEYEEVT